MRILGLPYVSNQDKFGWSASSVPSHLPWWQPFVWRWLVLSGWQRFSLARLPPTKSQPSRLPATLGFGTQLCCC